MSSQLLLQTVVNWDAPTLAKAAAGAFAVAGLVVTLSRRRSSLLFPPGPPPKPLLGNLLDLPPVDDAPWYKWSQWADIYGDELTSNSTR